MGWLKAIQAAWSMWNGKKFSSGAAITILATAFQQILAKQGVNADQAQMMATYIIQGVGAVIMVQEVVLPYSAHVGAQSFPEVHPELFQGPSLPLCRSLNYLGLDRMLVVIIRDVELDRRP